MSGGSQNWRKVQRSSWPDDLCSRRAPAGKRSRAAFTSETRSLGRKQQQAGRTCDANWTRIDTAALSSAICT